MLWIITDVSYLVYRAQYAMKKEGDAIYGFLGTITSLRNHFDSDNFIFCFDVGKLKRNLIYPEYKQNRRTDEHQEEHAAAKDLMTELRIEILPEFGFENILYQNGFEADDVIASVIKNSMESDETAVIVSSDSDLFQLLSPSVDMYALKPSGPKLITQKSFEAEWLGLKTTDWPMVKAIAGCSSDNIKGIRGIGEKSAYKFLSGNMEKGSNKYEKIAGCHNLDIKLRMRLVKLPFEGTNVFNLCEDEDVDWRWIQTYTHKEQS